MFEFGSDSLNLPPKCSFDTRGQFHKQVCALRQSIYALPPTFEKPFCGIKVWHRGRKLGVGCKTIYEIDPSWGLRPEAELRHLPNLQAP